MIGLGISPYFNRSGGVGLANGSLLFNAGTDYMVSDDASLLNDQIKGTTQKFSMSMWVKKNRTDQTYQTIFSRDNNSGGRQFACEFDDSDRWTFFIADSDIKYSWWKTVSHPVQTNTWYHLVITFDNTLSLANKCKLYINGAEVSTTRTDAGVGVSDVNDQPAEPIYINVTNFGGLINPVEGYLSRISFYTGILTAGDVTSMYNSGNGMDERSGLSISPYMLWNFANSTFGANIETDDIIGTSYPVSKKFISSGMSVSDFYSAIYPTPLVYQSETNTLLAAFGTAPTTARKDLIDDFIAGCKTDGNWTEMEVAVFLASHAQADAIVNWKNPGTYNGSTNGTLTYTGDEGYTGNGTTGYINTNFNGSTGTKYVLNSGSIGVYCRTSRNAADVTIGNLSGANASILVPRNADVAAGRVNSATNTTPASLNSTRLISVVRTASNAQAIWWHTTSLGSSAAVSTATINNNIFVLAYNNAGSAASFSQHQAAFYYISSGAIDVAKLSQRVHNYMSGLLKEI